MGHTEREVHDGDELEWDPHSDQYLRAPPSRSQQGHGEAECEQHPDAVVDLEDRVHAVDQGEAFTGPHCERAEGRHRPTEAVQAIPRTDRDCGKDGGRREGEGGGARFE